MPPTRKGPITSPSRSRKRSILEERQPLPNRYRTDYHLEPNPFEQSFSVLFDTPGSSSSDGRTSAMTSSRELAPLEYNGNEWTTPRSTLPLVMRTPRDRTYQEGFGNPSFLAFADNSSMLPYPELRPLAPNGAGWGRELGPNFSGVETRERIITNDELEQIQVFFKDAQKCRRVLETEGDEAQRWLDLLQALADHQVVPRKSKSAIFKVMLRLSKKSGMYPRCLKINNVEKMGSYPVAGGGFGDVWKGRVANEIVCLKVVKIYLASDVQQLLKEYMREAIVWQQLRHPNLLPFVGMYYLGEGQGQLCLVSPWMEQGNLVTFLKNAPPEWVDRTRLAYDVASGLAHLHSMKIVHGDMKGLNVLITPELRACIGDFGLSHVADSHAVKLSTSFASCAKGTTRWLAPELLNPELSSVSTEKSDMYAYGCVCYEIFAGRAPFHGLTDGAVVFAVLLKHQQPTRPEDSEEKDDGIWELMTSCWNAEPSLRPTAADALERLHYLSSIRSESGGIQDAPNWKAFNIDAIRGNVEYPRLDLWMLSQL
ncbi:Rho guanine nucleotide exchange factor [Marasmius sp. AFHP31]|nr:Rho guanine nucleotide exchange factor [Marasmius sp. AFHP31]